MLERGAIEILGRLPWSSNQSFLVAVTDGEISGGAAYKPVRGERGLWDFPGGLARREVAAYLLSELFGLGLVPETVLRTEAPFGAGSLQRFVDADFAQHHFTLVEDPRYERQLKLLAGLDLLLNNADRKSGHVLVDGSGSIFGIDNGLTFHPECKLRTVIWEFAGEEIPEAILEGSEELRRFDEAPSPTEADRAPSGCSGDGDDRRTRPRWSELRALLEPDEWVALRRRASRILERPRFPEPDPDRHCYPWPLV